MRIRTVSLAKAMEIFRGYGLEPGPPDVYFSGEKYQGVMCDYRSLKGYVVAFACDVRDLKGNQIARFNVMR